MKDRFTGLFGGSFNPPHIGHVAAARRAIDSLALEGLVILPAWSPPHKPLPPGTPSPEDRLAMTGLAFGDVPQCLVSDLEMRMRRPVYTHEAIDRIRPVSGSLILIVGSDMFLTLHEWARAGDILASTRVAVLSRASGQEKAISRQADFLAHRYGAAVTRVPHEPEEISSTRLRALLAKGRGWEYLPEKVATYIRGQKIYGQESGLRAQPALGADTDA